MNDALVGFLGAIIGSMLGLIGTLFALRHERKLSSERDSRKHEYDTKEWLRAQKVLLYTKFAGILDKVGIYIIHEEENFSIDKDIFEKLMNQIASFIEDNSGKISLFLPFDIQKEVMTLRSMIYKIVSDKETRTINDLTKIMEHPAMETTKKSIRIINMMRRDIGISQDKKDK